MTMNPKSRNGVGGWIVIAMICGGASGGATWLRPHNPNITTEAWIKMTVTVDRLEREWAELSRDVREVLRLVPQQPPPRRP